MYLKSFFFLLLSLILAGCATTRKGADTSGDQQSRITQLEQELEQKDEEINDLKDEVQALSEEKKKDYSTSRRASRYESVEPASRASQEIIRVDVATDQVQKALKNAGYYSGPIDGKVGDKTKKAIAEFQKANNLTPDGIIGKRTWNELKTFLE